MNPLSQFQNMPKEPGLGESRERENDNKAYNEQTIDFWAAKADVLESLYWKKVDQEQQTENTQIDSESNQIEKKEDITEVKTEENRYIPAITRLKETGAINTESYTIITWSIEQNSGELNLDNIQIESEEKQVLKSCVEALDPKRSEENIKKFSSDIAWIEEFGDYETNLDNDWRFESNVLNLVWENYIQIEWQNGELDKTWDILTAIQTTKNDILTNIKNIPKETQTYKTAIANISSWDLKKSLEWISSLYILSYSNDWKLAKKGKEVLNHKNKRKKELIEEAKQVTIDLSNAKQKNDQEKIKKFTKQKNEIIAEARDIESWDIFEAGDLDKVTEEEKNQKEVA